MKILIAGCGRVGIRLGIRLAAGGAEVWGARRDPSHLPAVIRPFSCDLADPSTLSDLPRGLDFVVYAASPDGATDESYRRVCVKGPFQLIRVLQAAGQALRRFLFVSSTAVYAQRDGEWVDEESPARPEHFSGKRLLEGEGIASDSGFSCVLVRFGGIYGPDRTRLIEQVRKGEATCPQGETVYTNRIHLDDCAGVLDHLLRLDNPAPLYLGVDDDPADRCQVVRWLAGRLGVPPPPSEEVTSRDSRTYRSNKRCSNARLRASGYRFCYPSYRDGYGAMLNGLTLARHSRNQKS